MSNQDLNQLDKKIDAAREKSSKDRPRENFPQSGAPQKDFNERAGLQLGVEMVAVIGVSMGIGYGLDTWLGTLPGFLIGFFFLGVITAFYNIYRIQKKINLETPGAPRVEKESSQKTDKKSE